MRFRDILKQAKKQIKEAEKEEKELTDEEAEIINRDFDKLRFYKDKRGKKKYYVKK